MSDAQQIEVRQRSSNGIGTAALVLGILACLGCWIPFVGVVAIPVAVIGIILAVIGFLIGLLRRSSTGGAVAGGIVSIIAIFITIIVTGKTADAIAKGIATSNQTKQTEQHFTPAAAAPVGSQPSTKSIPVAAQVSMEAPSVATQSTPALSPISNKSEESSVEFGTYAPGTYFAQGDIAIRIGSMTIGKVKVGSVGADKTSKDDFISMAILIKNQSESRKIEYNSWGCDGMSWNQECATLTDNFNNKYKRASFGFMVQPKGQLICESIYPGKEVADVLVFEPPVEKATELRLELPASYFGGKGYIRVRIPASFVKKL